MTRLLQRLQRGLEQLYRVDTEVEVGDYLLDEHARERLGPARSPREQLLVSQSIDGLELGLFVDRRALDNLDRNDPSARLDDRNMGDFLLTIEGVSHFVYLVWRAQTNQQVSALELELQAEIDKYVTCLLTTDGDAAESARLRRRLFEEFTYEPDLDAIEQRRYLVANTNAHRYSASLQRRFVERRRVAEMLIELRRFYRMSLPRKLEWISAAA